MLGKKVNILGTEYVVYTSATIKEEPRLKELYGFCDFCSKEIYISNECIEEDQTTMKKLEEFKNKVLRHEIIHAFLYESGLRENSNYTHSWAENEEMVDWFAIQSPKILQTFTELNLL